MECKFTLKRVCDMITYIQMHQTDKDSQNSSTIWPVWLNASVFFGQFGQTVECSFTH